MEGDPKFPGTQWHAELRLRAVRRALGLKGIFCDDGDRMRRGLGGGARAPTAPSCSRSRPTRRSRRCRRTSGSSRPRRWRRRWSRAIPSGCGVMEKSLRGKLVEFTESTEAEVSRCHAAARRAARSLAPTRSRPTSRSPTGRSSGTRRRSSSSRRTPAGRPVSATRTRRGRRRGDLLDQLAGVVEGDGRDGRAAAPGCAWARSSATPAGRGSASGAVPPSTRRSGT